MDKWEIILMLNEGLEVLLQLLNVGEIYGNIIQINQMETFP